MSSSCHAGRPAQDNVSLAVSEDEEVEALLAEQVAYYRARASEYDETTPIRHDDASRGQLVDALEQFAPGGRVLELACGTGEWTRELARHGSRVTAIDAAPEVLAIAAARVPDDRVRFIRGDIFRWQPDQRYDVVFFSAWLSHVPPQRFDRFWELVGDCLEPDGRVFLIDELPAVAEHEQPIAAAVAPTVERPLRDGSRYRAVKVFYEPGDLRARLATLGWTSSIRRVGWRFFYAIAERNRPTL
jgi:demethylmenaquinone methyltransferase/2-methoxy-6-polyprenyl-1,4-benzoquinol methylase